MLYFYLIFKREEMKKFLKKITPKKWRRKFHEKNKLHMRAALKRASSRGIDIGTVIDVGASDGRWTMQTLDYFPDANYLLIEANPVHEESLKKFCKNFQRISYKIAAASDKNGYINFDGDDPFGGKAEPDKCANPLKVKSIRLDDLITSGEKLKLPFFLKLDTHGYEVPIIEGASDILSQASLIVIETYNFQIAKDSLIFDEMVSYMRTKGFGIVDISDPLWRPGDRCFWQIDLYFEPLSKEQFKINTFN